MRNNTILKFKLKSYWDFPQSYNLEEKSSIFVGRKQEKEKLVDVFIRKKCSSILLCGPRGVGKTALVYKALQEVKLQKKGIIPAILNVSQIEAHKENGQIELTHKDVLINLIRRLYTTLLKEDKKLLSDKVKNLYFKAAAKNWQFEKILGKEIEKIDLRTDEKVIKLNIDINLKSLISKIIGVLMVFLAIYPQLFPYSNIIFGILGIIAFFFEYIDIWLRKSNISKLIKSLVERTKDRAEETYLIDASVGNLEYELSEVLSELALKNRKIIFIVDELDKYSKEPKKILELIKTYKNLFSLTPAIFLFIAGNEIYESFFNIPKHRRSLLGDSTKNNIESELYRTSFSEVFYLSRPNYGDISNYLDQILKEEELEEIKGDKEKLKRWEEFKHYLGFDSEDDFFKLIRLTKNFTKEEGSNEVFIEITQKNFLDRERAKAKFHKALFLIYKDSSFNKPTEWAYNELLYFGLFDVLKVLATPNFQIQLLFNQDRDEIKESQKKLVDVLEKFGAIKVTQRDENQSEFNWTHKDFEIGDTIEGPYPHEEKFMKAFDELLTFSQKLAEVFNKSFSTEEKLIKWIQSVSGISVLSNFNLFKNSKVKIKRNEHFNIEDTTRYEEELKNELQNLHKNILGIYVNSLLQLLTNAQQGKLNQNSNLFSLLDSGVSEKIKRYNHSIIYKPNLSKQILIIEDFLREDLLKLNKWNKNFNFHYKIIYIKNDNKNGIQFTKYLKVDDIIEWFNNNETKLNIGGISKAIVISGISSKEVIKRKSYLKLNKVEGVLIDGKKPHTFLVIDKEYTDFNANLEVLLMGNGIFNFVFGFNENKNKQLSFYIVRLDSRKGFKNSLLQANYGSFWDNIIQEGQSITSANVTHYLEVLFKNNNLQVTLDKTPIISYAFPLGIKGKIGIMNELEDVLVRKVQIK